MGYTLIDKTITDLETLEVIASGYLSDHKSPIINIKVVSDDPLTDAALEIGDLVTVTSSEANIDGTYHIVKQTFKDNYGTLEMETEVSNKSLDFIEQLNKAKQQAEAMEKYMQGATNIYSIQSYENCDNSFPLYIRFYIPEDAVAINNVTLKFTTRKFRGYTEATEVNSESSSVSSSGGNASNIYLSPSTWTNVTSVATSATDCEGIFLNGDISISDVDGSSAGTYTLKYRIFDGTNYYPSSDGISGVGPGIWNDSPLLFFPFSQYLPGNNKSKNYYLQAYSGVAGMNVYVNGSIHYITFSRHTHNTGYSISEETFPTGTPQVKVEVANSSEVSWSSATGSPFNVSNGGTYSADITTLVSNIGAGNWVTVKLTPQNGTSHNNLRIEANINIKVFIQST
jgi:hypothetical protein